MMIADSFNLHSARRLALVLAAVAFVFMLDSIFGGSAARTSGDLVGGGNITWALIATVSTVAALRWAITPTEGLPWAVSIAAFGAWCVGRAVVFTWGLGWPGFPVSVLYLGTLYFFIEASWFAIRHERARALAGGEMGDHLNG